MKTDPTPYLHAPDATYNGHELRNTLACGTIFLGWFSLAPISLILILLDKGFSPQSIEKGMVWLSVPWFALCYALCRIAHGIKFVVTHDSDNQNPPL